MQASFFIGPHRTPTCVKWMIWLTAVVSVLSPVLTYFLARYHLPGPGAWLALSLPGLEQGWLWQPLTYMFVHSAGSGINLHLLISIFFNMLLLWFAGSEIAYRYSCRHFLLFYLGGGLLAGLVASGLLFLFSSTAIITGSSPAVYALITFWAMIYPDLELFFFFLLRIKTKWLVAFYLGLALLMNLSAGAIIPFVADLTGILWGFLIGRFVYKLANPFPLNLDLPFKKRSKHPDDKIIDISVFQESDEDFTDRMLEKIAQSGESSLTPRERDRLHKISQKHR